MDGNIFFSNRFDPSSEAIDFNFDLQRFAKIDVEEGATTPPTGAKFSVTKDGTTTYYDADEDFKSGTDSGTDNALENATNITILGDITLSEDVIVDLGDDKDNKIKVVGTATLNLGANNLTISRTGTISDYGYPNDPSSGNVGEAYSAILVQDGANFTVKGTTGQIEYDWQPTDVKKARNSAAIQIGENVGTYNDTTVSSKSSATFNMESGTVKSYTSAVTMSDNGVLNVNGGTVTSTNSCGVYYGNTSPGGGTINVNGGTIETGTASKLPAIQVSGSVGDVNSKAYNTVDGSGNITEVKAKAAIINVTGGTIAHKGTNGLKTENGELTIDGNPNAICASGNVDLNISGGTITSTGTAVEIRAGSLDISGGNIESTATQYLSLKKSGGSSYGVGVSIAQHTTLQNIDVNISGTTNISGLNALGVANPQGNDKKASGIVTATIDGGNLSSKAPSVSGDSSQGGNAIFANNANIVITVNNGTLSGNVTVSKVKDATTDTNDATVVVAGGTTTGKVQVLEKETASSTTETLVTGDEGKKSLQVVGGKISDSDSASDYVADGAQVNKDGTVTESSNNGWSLASDNKYSYMLSGKTPLISASLASGTTDSVTFKYDTDNKTFAFPGEYTTAWDGSTDARKPYGLAKYTLESGGGAIKIEPVKPREGYKYVKVSGNGLFDNTIVTLTAAGEVDSLGLYVDATDNRLAHIIGGAGKDSLKAGDRRTTLDGGANDDTLDGGEGIDTFIYSAGKDVINNYEHGTDTVSVSSELAPPIDFGAFDGSNFVLKFNDANQLTFRSVAEVALTKGTDVYTYQGNTNGTMNYIAHEGNGISLGSGYSGRFNGTTAANEDYKTIDAERVGSAIRITGNDKANYIVASSMGGGTLEGGEGNDTLTAAENGASSLTLNGGAGDDSLVGGEGYNLFVYNEGSDSISGYHAGDLVTVRGVNLEKADFSFTDKNIKLGFESNDDNLTFENVIGEGSVPISVQSGSKNLYVYEKEKISHDKSVTLTSGYSANSFAANDFDNINAVAVSLETGAISISGNDNNNVIFGSKYGGSIFGGKGNDKLDVTERGDGKNFVFQYTEGKDTVSGFVADDKLEITAERLGQISKAKSSQSDTRLAFTFNTSKSDVLTFNSEDEIERVSLNGDSGFLTKDGVVSIDSTSKSNSLDLFASAKGKIDLTSELYSVDGGIASVSAADVAKQSVTLIGASVEGGSSYTFAGNNKKKDQFEYNGGNVTISGYEAGKDRFDFNTAALSGFSVGADGGNVSLNAGNNSYVVLESMQGHEVLMHHADSKRSSFTKMVFKQEGVILNKEKRPTMATVYSGANNYSAATEDTTVKKIFIADGASSLAITAGDRNKTTLDASASNGNISLTGGTKNDKLIGSTVAADTFIYTGGKDIIQNYSSNDQISLGSFKDNLLNSKISAGSRSIKFKFAGSSKNTLTIKPAKGSTLGDALKISDIPSYTFAKNAIASGSNVSLTSEFSGSYRLKNSNANNVDGHLVEKNLTFRGTSSDETLAGGTKKTTFKGGGGNDSLKGGSGNDIFFYAKGDKGDATIADFDFNKDKLKIASGTITKISNSDGKIKFDMNSGKKGSANIGSFTIGNIIGGYDAGKTVAAPDKTVIKANNTYYWFAEAEGKDASGESYAKDALITSVNRVSKSDTTGYAVIDLGYSSNLVNAGVAYKTEQTLTKLSNTAGGSSNSGTGE